MDSDIKVEIGQENAASESAFILRKGDRDDTDIKNTGANSRKSRRYRISMFKTDDVKKTYNVINNVLVGVIILAIASYFPFLAYLFASGNIGEKLFFYKLTIFIISCVIFLAIAFLRVFSLKYRMFDNSSKDIIDILQSKSLKNREFSDTSRNLVIAVSIGFIVTFPWNVYAVSNQDTKSVDFIIPFFLIAFVLVTFYIIAQVTFYKNGEALFRNVICMKAKLLNISHGKFEYEKQLVSSEDLTNLEGGGGEEDILLETLLAADIRKRFVEWCLILTFFEFSSSLLIVIIILCTKSLILISSLSP